MREWQRPGIPLLPGPLVGRQAELSAARKLLLWQGARLVTLTGPPGVGKTSLALALAVELRDQFADGARFVDLSTVTDAELVATVMADSLGAAGAGGGSTGGAGPLARLIAFLANRSCLVIVDNFEQVIGAAPLIAELLRTCGGLTFLVTSRAALRLRWERELLIPPLELPDRGGPISPEALEGLAAVRLFVERARAVRPGFGLTPGNAPAIAELCHRLDGLPLAIELAAARARLLAPEAMLDQLADADADARQGWPRLGSGLDVLTGGARDLPPRQQALATAIDWSHALLDDDERAMFRRLAVFVGGCTLDAIQAICDGVASSELRATNDGALTSQLATHHSLLDVVASLVEKSLLRRELAAPGEPRLRMLETIRAYALRALVATDEAEPVRARHAACYLELAERAAPELEGADQGAWLDRLDGERDNLRAAGRWAAERGEAEMVLRLGAALWRFWWARANAAEARERVEGMLALARVSPPSLARVKALHGAGVLAHELGDYPRSEALLDESLAMARRLDDRRAIGQILDSLGWLAQQRGQYAEARALLEESLAVTRQLGEGRSRAVVLARLGYVAFALGEVTRARSIYDESLALARAASDRRVAGEVLFNLGLLCHVQGDLAEARQFYEESRVVLRALGHRPGLAQTLHMLAHLLTMTGDTATARGLFLEALVTAREVGNRRRLAFALWTVAALLVAEGDPEQAVRLDAAASAAAEAMGAALARPVRALYDALLAPAQQALGEQPVATARQAGRALGLEAAVDEALGWLARTPDVAPTEQAPTRDARPVADRSPVEIAGTPAEVGTPANPPDRPGQSAPGGRRSELLTRREREIAGLIGRGLTSREIAEHLVIGKGTVDAHADHIRDKLDLRSRAEIAAWAVRAGLLETPSSTA